LEELIPNELTMGGLIAVLRNLLAERISIRDFRTILEALADHAPKIKDPDELTERVRQRMGRQVTAHHATPDGKLFALVLAPSIESTFRRMQGGGGGMLDPAEVRRLMESFEGAVAQVGAMDDVPVVVCAADIRRSVGAFVRRHLPQVSVLSFRELASKTDLQTLGVIGDAGEVRA